MVAIAEEDPDGTLAWTLYPAGCSDRQKRKRTGYSLGRK